MDTGFTTSWYHPDRHARDKKAKENLHPAPTPPIAASGTVVPLFVDGRLQSQHLQLDVERADKPLRFEIPQKFDHLPR